MKTLTFKLPEILEARLNMLAQKNGLNRSEIVRRALMEYFSNDNVNRSGSFLDLAQDLAGCLEGPKDLSSNKVHLESYGK